MFLHPLRWKGRLSVARRKSRPAGRSGPINGPRAFGSAPAAGRRSLPYDPLSDSERVFSLFGQNEIPPRRWVSTVRPLIRTVLGDTKRQVRSLPKPYGERLFTRVMNNALPLGSPSLCGRRAAKREVLFARGLTGKGSRSKRTIRPDSFIRCRR